MMYNRQFYIYSSLKSFLQAVLCFFGPILTLALLNMLGVFGSVLGRPVSQTLFGKSLIWFEVIVIVIIISGLSLSIFLSSKTAYFQHHSQFLIKREKKEFIKKYGLQENTIDAFMPKASYRHVWLTLLATLLMPVTIFLYEALFPKLFYESVAVFLGFTAMAVPFYYVVGKYIKKVNLSAQPLIEYFNTQLPYTNLRYIPTKLGYSVNNPSVGLGQGLHGQYQGYEANFHLNLSGLAAMNKTKVRGKAEASVCFKKSLNKRFLITITEKKNTWRKIKGATLDACFEKRFILKGISLVKLPQKIKELCLNNDRPLFLTFTEKEVLFKSRNLTIYPAYSIYGEILFIDFLTELAKSLSEEVLKY